MTQLVKNSLKVKKQYIVSNKNIFVTKLIFNEEFNKKINSLTLLFS